jgi:hypothetical protein
MFRIGTRCTRQQWMGYDSLRSGAETALRRNDCYKAGDRQRARHQQN